MDQSDEFAFGKALRRLRQAAGLTQEALAERARLSVEAISALERGTRRAPFARTTALLADALELSTQDRAALESARAGPRRTPLKAPIPAFAGPLPLPPNNLPAQLSTVIGRDSIFPVVGELLEAERLVTLVGTGGVGKTRTALAVATLHLAAYPDGVWFSELASLNDARLIAQTVAASLGVHFTRKRPALESLHAALRTRELLLVLDNCEHVIDEAAVFADNLLRACPRVSILATSRERLNVSGERVYRLPSLETPPPGADVSGDGLRAYGACALFCARARSADGDFTVKPGSEAHIAEICRRLDGIPLAIELAAARVRVLSPAQLASGLDERFRILTGGSRTALPRQQTMRATIDWSYELLTASERELLRRVAIFAGGWTFAAAHDVCATDPLDRHDVTDALHSLVEKSLVVTDFTTGEGRYRLLESTRAYALEKLAAQGDLEALTLRHAGWVASLTVGLRKAYYSLPREAWLQQLGPELDNIRSALDYALQSKSDAALTGRIMWLARVSNALSVDSKSRS